MTQMTESAIPLVLNKISVTTARCTFGLKLPSPKGAIGHIVAICAYIQTQPSFSRFALRGFSVLAEHVSGHMFSL